MTMCVFVVIYICVAMCVYVSMCGYVSMCTPTRIDCTLYTSAVNELGQF